MRLRNVKNKKEILNSFSHVIDNPKDYKGKWQGLFDNNNEIHLEIGTGRCRFILANANKYPNINFIGIERSDSVLALGIKDIDTIPDNLYLINYNAEDILDLFSKEIDLLYLNFSDPWPKDRHEKRRLTSDNFLNKYDLIFKDKKEIILKTDNISFFEYSLKSFVFNNYLIKDISLDLHNSKINDNIITEYEEKFSNKGQVIYMVNVYKK